MSPKAIRDWFLKVKSNKDKLVSPATNLLYKYKIKPNYVSSVGFIFGLVAVYYLFSNQVLFIIFLLANRLVDAVDGPLARKFGIFSEIFGFDVDRVADVSLGGLMIVKAVLIMNPLIVVAALFVYFYDVYRVRDLSPGFNLYLSSLWLFMSLGLFTTAIYLQFVAWIIHRILNFTIYRNRK